RRRGRHRRSPELRGRGRRGRHRARLSARSGCPGTVPAPVRWTRTRRDREHAREAVRSDRWFALLTMTRPLGAAVAVALLLVHDVTREDVPLAALTVVWTGVTLL